MRTESKRSRLPGPRPGATVNAAQAAVPCPLCGALGSRPQLSAQDPHYGIRGSFALRACPVCGVWFLHPMLTAAELLALYPQDSYYAYLAPPSPEPRWRCRVRAALGFRVRRLDPGANRCGRLLDLGCGVGAYLLEMRHTQLECWGVEPNPAAAAAGRAAGLAVRAGTLVEAGLPANFFDVVRANHSFEHVPDAHATLEEIHRILKPGGRLLLGLPNTRSLAARLYQRDWWHVSPPLHAFHYAPPSIRRLLQCHGLHTVSLRCRSDYAGLLGSWQIRWNRSRGRVADTGAFWRNPALRILAQWITLLVDLSGFGDCMEVAAVKPAAPDER